MKIEEFQFCPKCGAALNQGAGLAQETAPGRVTCGACGTTLQASDFAAGALALQRRGNRNPLALVVVALIVAGMLYFGVHMSRRAEIGRAHV